MRTNTAITISAIIIAASVVSLFARPQKHEAPVRCVSHETCLEVLTARQSPAGATITIDCGYPAEGDYWVPHPFQVVTCGIGIEGGGVNVCLSERLVFWPRPKSYPVTQELIQIHPGDECQ